MKLYNIESKIYVNSKNNSEILWDFDNFILPGDNEYEVVPLAIAFLHNKHRIKGHTVEKITWLNNEHTKALIEYDYKICTASEKVCRYELKIEEIETTGF
jgi:hypothetical protein